MLSLQSIIGARAPRLGRCRRVPTPSSWRSGYRRDRRAQDHKGASEPSLEKQPSVSRKPWTGMSNMRACESNATRSGAAQIQKPAKLSPIEAALFEGHSAELNAENLRRTGNPNQRAALTVRIKGLSAWTVIPKSKMSELSWPPSMRSCLMRSTSRTGPFRTWCKP